MSEANYYLTRCDLWKRAAKKWRASANEYYSAYREELTNKYELGTRWALARDDATRRLELLRRLHELGILDPGVPMHDLGECEDCDLVREVEKELANA